MVTGPVTVAISRFSLFPFFAWWQSDLYRVLVHTLTSIQSIILTLWRLGASCVLSVTVEEPETRQHRDPARHHPHRMLPHTGLWVSCEYFDRTPSSAFQTPSGLWTLWLVLTGQRPQTVPGQLRKFDEHAQREGELQAAPQSTGTLSGERSDCFSCESPEAGH